MIAMHRLAPLLILLCALASPDRAATQGEPGEEIAIESVLVIERVGHGGRSPVFTDAIEASLAQTTWRAPAEGDTVTGPGGSEKTWRRLEGNGDFSDRALRGGYAFATVEMPAERVMLLRARGHRHVYVNGEPRGGDVYDLGLTRLAVHLLAGKNEFLFKGGRGRLRAALEPAPAPVFFEPRDRTIPDVVAGETAPIWMGLIVTNATTRWQVGLEIEVTGPEIEPHTTTLAPLPPLSSTKAAVSFTPPAIPQEPQLALEVQLGDGRRVLHEASLVAGVRLSTASHRRSFRSAIDGSVQYYGVTPPVADSQGESPPALYLSLHGAGVEAGHQARCYTSKENGFVVAPTNRRPFGFDWEDWGRLDALEVLDHASTLFGADPRRTYLTGHSMGGHGTWNFGAHYPDRFAAIAPSAGWRDFWSYGGGATWREPTAVEQLCERAANASRTLLLKHNYQQLGVYVLHGEGDQTVPVAQARAMRSELAGFHSNFAYYERAGAGHWWGNQCMDWPPLFAFLDDNVRPEPAAIRRVAFTTVSPGISARSDWVTVEAQLRSFATSHVEAVLDVDKRSVTVTTDNVARLALDLSPFAEPLATGELMTAHIDDQQIEVPWPESAVVRLARQREAWELAEPPRPDHKGPHRAGPFKDAFRHRMVFVVGTKGTLEENSWALHKARYDAETFQYRGNGAVEIVPDAAFDPAAYPDRSVILYGNADTNSAWQTLLPGCPVEVRRGLVRVGDRSVKGDDLACLFVYPRADSDIASVGVVAGTGAAGTALTHQLPYFVSGVGYPDWIVLGAEMLEQGKRGIRGAGFFGPDWSLDTGEAAWR